MKHVQRQQFSFTKTSITVESKVSLKIMTQVSRRIGRVGRYFIKYIVA